MRLFTAILSILGVIGFFAACQQNSGSVETQLLPLQERIDALELQIEQAYKPGFGDLMGSIQVHHNKLWFAGINENWALAEFAIHEIEELLEDIKDFHNEKPESASLPMIFPALEALDKIIDDKNSGEFKKGYLTLSNTCNACHTATGFEFIKIVIPTTPALSNQDFKP